MEVEMSLTEPNHRMLSVVYQDVSTLKPRATTPRTHSKKYITQLANAIRRFGFTNPALVDDANGIIAGHGRVEAAALPLPVPARRSHRSCSLWRVMSGLFTRRSCRKTSFGGC